ncbi:MAG: hypothetical protein ACR2JB_03695 [Bryobacteraceae bacterium]
MKKKLIRVAKGTGLALAIVLGGLALELQAQFGGIVSDPIQEGHSWQQLLNDIQKLQRLDHQIQTIDAELNQIQMSARYFSVKNAWRGFGNQIVRNWAPNSYGAIPLWNAAVLFGPGAPQAWQNVIVSMRRNPYMVGITPGSNREYAYAATVDTFDGAGPTAIETLGNARTQQTQMSTAIAQLQASALDGSLGTNSEVQQLNLLTAGSVQGLQMQQTTNNVVTSLLEQQTIANKIQRDALADHLNFLNQADQYMVSEGPMWGDAAQAITGARLQ